MAADSASTDLSAGTKQSSNCKIEHFRNHKSLFGGSGDVGLLQKIHERIDKLHSSYKDISKFRFDLKTVIVEELNLAIRIHAPYPTQPYHDPPGAVCIVAGYIDGTPYLIEYERNGADTDFTKSGLGNFVAIGSGKPLAQALFRPHLFRTLNAQTGKVIAYRVLSDAIAIASFGLSEPIHMYCMDKTGKVEICTDIDRGVYRETCGLWREMEFDALGKLAPQTAEQEEKNAEEIPTMEDIPHSELNKPNTV
jgi:20S proteasome alpha/beta subunit